MYIRIVSHQGYLTQHVSKLRDSLTLLYNALNSDSFRQAVLQHSPFKTRSGVSNSFIYGYIMRGQEPDTDADQEADLRLVLLHEPSPGNNVIGYTQGGVIYTYVSFFENPAMQPAHLAGHYAHEYCHVLGFADPADEADLPVNVPYEVGRIITGLALQVG